MLRSHPFKRIRRLYLVASDHPHKILTPYTKNKTWWDLHQTVDVRYTGKRSQYGQVLKHVKEVLIPKLKTKQEITKEDLLDGVNLVNPNAHHIHRPAVMKMDTDVWHPGVIHAADAATDFTRNQLRKPSLLRLIIAPVEPGHTEAVPLQIIDAFPVTNNEPIFFVNSGAVELE